MSTNKLRRPLLLILDSDEVRRNEISRVAAASHRVCVFTGLTWFEGQSRLEVEPEFANGILFHQSNSSFKSLLKAAIWNCKPTVVWYSGGGVLDGSILDPPGFGIVEPVRVRADTNDVMNYEDEWSSLFSWLASKNRDVLPVPKLFFPRSAPPCLSSIAEFIRVFLVSHGGLATDSSHVEVLKGMGFVSGRFEVSDSLRTWVSDAKNWKTVLGDDVAKRLRGELKEKSSTMLKLLALAKSIDSSEDLDLNIVATAYDEISCLRVK